MSEARIGLGHAACAGSGQPAKEKIGRTVVYSCPDCGGSQKPTKDGKTPKHKRLVFRLGF